MPNHSADDTVELVEETLRERKDCYMGSDIANKRDKYSVHGLLFLGDEECIEFDARSTDPEIVDFCFLVVGKAKYNSFKVLNKVLEKINPSLKDGTFFMNEEKVFFRCRLFLYSDNNTDYAINYTIDNALKEILKHRVFIREIANEKYDTLISTYFQNSSFNYAINDLKTKIKNFHSN